MSHKLNRAHEDLGTAWRGLRQMWQSLQQEWQDDAARRFAAEQWPAFESTTSAVLSEIAALQALLRQAERDVE